MNNNLDIAIEVHFLSKHGTNVELINKIARPLVWAVHDAEREELEALIKHFDHWTSVEQDAMRYRFNKLNHEKVLNIEYGGQGSLLLIGAAAGFAYWVVDKTLGETVKEAWIESEGHARLKDFLKARVFKKRDHIVRNFRRMSLDLDEAKSTAVKSEEGCPRIVVEVVPKEAARIPKSSEISPIKEQNDE